MTTRPDAPDLAGLAGALPAGAVLRPDAPGYADATSPDNSSFPRHPDAVVRPRSAGDVATAVAAAGALGLRVAVQATGHGAGAPVDGGVLVDTSSLDAVAVDPEARTARVGAGAHWSQVQAEAEKHGLLGLSGTSPTVGVAGYTFHGGVGWLVRPHGLASASLRAVEWVDGRGALHRTDAAGADPDALWAFRGGAPVGIATELEIGLVAVTDVWAGYLLWPADRLADLAAAWVERLATAPAGLTSTLAVLRLPPRGPFPAQLLGTPVVHLSYASTDGEAGLADLRGALRAVAEPAVDTTGPADATVLAQIHLDPPGGIPARGTGLWLGALDADQLVTVAGAARIGADDGLNMIEFRHVAPSAGAPEPAVDGALTAVPGPFLLHAVGAAPDDDGRGRVDARLARVEAAAAPVAVGLSAPSFREGQPDTGDAYRPADLDRLLAAARRADPDDVFAFQRVPQR